MQLLIAGCAVSLESSTAAELNDLQAALVAGVPVEGPPQLVLRSECGSVPMPQRKADRVVQHVRYWDEGDSVIVAPGPGLAALVSRGHALLDPGTLGVRGVHGLLLPVLSLLFRQRDACLVHAAAVLFRDEAALVLGGSGQGKSTLVAAAISLGLPILGDDMVVLRLRGDKAFVSGVPIPLALPGDQAHHPAIGLAIAGDPRQRHHPAGPASLESGEYQVGTVLLVEHSGQDGGHLQAVGGRAVLGSLLRSTLDGLAPGNARGIFPFAAAVSKAGGWSVGHAANPAIRLTAAAARLDQLRSEPGSARKAL